MRTIEKDNLVYYCANDIGKVLGLSKTRNSIKHIPKSEHIYHVMSTPGGLQKMSFITKTGVQWLLTKSRKQNIEQIAKLLDVEVKSMYIPPLERTLLDTIHEVFPGIFQEQYCVEGASGKLYRLDAYSKKYNIAIECDELYNSYHSNTGNEYDKIREDDIHSKIKCRWIRQACTYNSKEELKLIRNIHEAILDTYRTTE